MAVPLIMEAVAASTVMPVALVVMEAEAAVAVMSMVIETAVRTVVMTL